MHTRSKDAQIIAGVIALLSCVFFFQSPKCPTGFQTSDLDCVSLPRPYCLLLTCSMCLYQL